MEEYARSAERARLQARVVQLKARIAEVKETAVPVPPTVIEAAEKCLERTTRFIHKLDQGDKARRGTGRGLTGPCKDGLGQLLSLLDDGDLQRCIRVELAMQQLDDALEELSPPEPPAQGEAAPQPEVSVTAPADPAEPTSGGGKRKGWRQRMHHAIKHTVDLVHRPIAHAHAASSRRAQAQPAGAESQSQGAEESAQGEENLGFPLEWVDTCYFAGSSPAEFVQAVATNRDFARHACWEGFPDQVRAECWWALLGAKRTAPEGQYERLVFSKVPHDIGDIISRDVPRTFPEHPTFRSGVAHQALTNLLIAYAALDAEVGYVQGMSFLAAVFLVGMPPERAFWSFAHMMSTEGPLNLRHMYVPGLPGHPQAMEIFTELIQRYLPSLADHFEFPTGSDGCSADFVVVDDSAPSLTPSFYATEWFSTMFSYRLPLNLVVRIWDCAFVLGMPALFQVALALLSSLESRLLTLRFDSSVELLKNFQKGAWEFAENPDGLLQLARQFHVTAEELGWGSGPEYGVPPGRLAAPPVTSRSRTPSPNAL
eukprot:TRINITY_DN16381_c0_g1_i1.p1 TRINITY_DN16381_c0_g1~~TRINITY_DN16381_c0_g1_i1.p1  ORF type:complete len:541 (+),score=80.39 TRINITY_DN16381_c0_g1_i1:41-1663(+)